MVGIARTEVSARDAGEEGFVLLWTKGRKGVADEPRSIGIFDPTFLFGEIPLAFEIHTRSHAGESELPQLIDDLFDGSGDGFVDAAFQRQCFVHHAGLVSAIHSFDRDESIEISVAGIDAFELVLFDDRVFRSQKQGK